jgi:hypothetical protein
MYPPLYARPARDPDEERKIRKLAGARHAPADWILRARMITLSWGGNQVTARVRFPKLCASACTASTPRGWTGSATGGSPDAPVG